MPLGPVTKMGVGAAVGCKVGDHDAVAEITDGVNKPISRLIGASRNGKRVSKSVQGSVAGTAFVAEGNVGV